MIVHLPYAVTTQAALRALLADDPDPPGPLRRTSFEVGIGPSPSPSPSPYPPTPTPTLTLTPDNPDPNQVGMGPELASESGGGTAEAAVEQVTVRIRVS